jgi:festuclavine dehydrogenase
LSEALSRKISHVNLTLEELENRFVALGLSRDHVKPLVSLDKAIEQGAEDRLNDVVMKVTGQAPRTFRDFVEANKANWTL